MSYSADGLLNGGTYHIDVGSPGAEHGIASGSDNIMALLAQREGQPYAATPTGPFGRLDMSDPSSILGALMGWTRLTMLYGEWPGILGGPPEPGVVY